MMVELAKTGWTLQKLRSYRDDILRIASRHGASNIRVFGSIARGEATPDSDIDLLIDQDWSQLGAWGGIDLILELEDFFGCKVDITTVEELKPYIQERVLKDAVAL